MMRGLEDEATDRALQGISNDARAMRLGEHLPAGKRPKLVLTIEMGEPEGDLEEPMLEDEEEIL